MSKDFSWLILKWIILSPFISIVFIKFLFVVFDMLDVKYSKKGQWKCLFFVTVFVLILKLSSSP